MPINWFPGPQNATRQAIKDRVKAGLDGDRTAGRAPARLQQQSAAGGADTGRPSLKVLNKQDLADPLITGDWLAHYNAQPHTRAIALDASDRSPARADRGLPRTGPGAATCTSRCGC
jgi:ribosome biogenesis GTPase A